MAALAAPTIEQVQGWYYEPRVVSVDECFIDPAYQRALTSLAKEIGADFRPYLFGAVIVSERERKTPNLALIDGQNRWVGAREAGEDRLLAIVYKGLTRADEALIFSDLQTRRRNLASYDKFRAALVGKDPEALAIASIVRHAGYELGPEKRPDTVKAVGALQWAFRGGRTKRQKPLEAGPEYLRRAMHAMRAAWPDISQPNGDIIKGTVLLYVNAEGDLDDDRLCRTLNSRTPREILAQADDLRAGRGGGGSGASWVGEVLATLYAKARKSR